MATVQSSRSAWAEAVALERRAGRWAGAAAFLSVGTLIGALLTATSAGGPLKIGASSPSGDLAHQRLRELVDFHTGPAAQAAAMILHCVGLALLVAVGLYLYWLVRRRGVGPTPGLVAVTIAGPLLVLAATVFGYVVVHHASQVFYASGPRTAARASQLMSTGSVHVASFVDLLTRVVLGAWILWSSVKAMRCGLLTGFLGYWGMFTAVAEVILPVGDAFFIGWLASIAFLAVGYWPGGRPEGWERTAVGAQAGSAGG